MVNDKPRNIQTNKGFGKTSLIKSFYFFRNIIAVFDKLNHKSLGYILNDILQEGMVFSKINKK